MIRSFFFAMLLAAFAPTAAAEEADNALIGVLLESAQKDLRAFRLTSPVGRNAFEKYREILALDPENRPALEGMVRIVKRYLSLVDSQIKRGQADRARRYLRMAERVMQDSLLPAVEEGLLTPVFRAEVRRVVEEIASLKGRFAAEAQRQAMEAERQARTEAQRQESTKAQRQAIVEAQRQAMEAERQARTEAQRQESTKAQRQAIVEAQRQERTEAQRQAIVEAQRQARVVVHAWQGLTGLDTSEHGYGLYTYVLLPRRVNELEQTDQRAASRYENLLRAIVAATPDVATTTQYAERREVNIFYIPHEMRSPSPGKVYSGYNSSLSQAILGSLSGALAAAGKWRVSERLARRSGPFLLSVTEPIGSARRAVPTLYVDLSDMNPAAMGEVVATYKQWVIKSESTGATSSVANEPGVRIKSSNQVASRTSAQSKPVTAVESLRLSLLSMILDADDNLSLFRVAVADWLPQ